MRAALVWVYFLKRSTQLVSLKLYARINIQLMVWLLMTAAKHKLINYKYVDMLENSAAEQNISSYDTPSVSPCLKWIV